MRQVITILIIGGALFSCNYSNIENKSTSVDNQNEINDLKITDTLHQILHNSFDKDSFEYSSFEPFLFIKTGYILSDKKKNALLISCPSDSTYKIELFEQDLNRWIKNDEIEVDDAFPIQFHLVLNDYNFDGINDIYIQCSVSNSYALSIGHLITINPSTYKFESHPETRNLANMQPFPKSKTIISEDIIWNVKGFQGVCDLKNKWINGKLKTIKRENPSINPQGF